MSINQKFGDDHVKKIDLSQLKLGEDGRIELGNQQLEKIENEQFNLVKAGAAAPGDVELKTNIWNCDGDVNAGETCYNWRTCDVGRNSDNCMNYISCDYNENARNVVT